MRCRCLLGRGQLQSATKSRSMSQPPCASSRQWCRSSGGPRPRDCAGTSSVVREHRDAGPCLGCADARSDEARWNFAFWQQNDLTIVGGPTFGRDIPVLVHELEFSEAIAEQNARCNPSHLVAPFTQWIDSMYR